MVAPEPGSPLWLVNRLYKRLMKRRAVTDSRWKYYIGDQPLPVLHDRVLSLQYERLLKHSQTNVCGLIADAVQQRMQVDGFRVVGSTETNDEAWRIWQENHLDADFDLVLREMLATGYSYMMVWPDADDETTPIITPESCRDTITVADPGNRRKVSAALRVWVDELSGDIFANLYTPNALYKWRSKYDDLVSSGDDYERKWEIRQVEGEAWPAPNPLGVVPVIPFINDPDMYGNGRSEFEQALKIQDRLNKRLTDLAITIEYGSFKQKWATGFDVPTDEDGQPLDDIKTAITRMIVSENPDTKFGAFDATDPSPILEAVKTDIIHALAVTQTPPSHSVMTMVNIGTDAIRETGAALVTKVWARNRFTGESLEQVMRLALRSAGSEADSRMETVWHSPETYTLAERADAATKYRSIGYPTRKILEMDGKTPAEIEEFMQMKAQETTVEGFGDPMRMLEQ